jgi:hypothetical protein
MFFNISENIYIYIYIYIDSTVSFRIVYCQTRGKAMVCVSLVWDLTVNRQKMQLEIWFLCLFLIVADSGFEGNCQGILGINSKFNRN